MGRLRLIFTGAVLACAPLHAQTAATAAHIGKGYELVQNQRFDQAAQEFREALALDPGNLKVRYQFAVCLFALGERDESRKEFERLKSTTQDDPSVAYYLARLDLLSGDFTKAIQRLASIMADPPFPDASFYLGSAYLSQGDVAKAMKWLREAARTNPRDFRIHYRLARALQQTGARKEAEAEYARSTEMREIYNQTARQSVECTEALRTKPLADARALCNRIFDPNDADRLTMLGMLYGGNGKYEEAIEPLKRAAELDRDSFEVYHNLGLTYFRLKRFAEARAPLEKAVSLRPDYFGSNALLGATLYSLKDDEAAYRVLGFAHDLNPEDGDTAELLFRVAVILGAKRAAAADYAGALPFLETAAKLRPADTELAGRIAEIRRRLDRRP
jgi:Flp pilus assembly protein TadD